MTDATPTSTSSEKKRRGRPPGPLQSVFTGKGVYNVNARDIVKIDQANDFETDRKEVLGKIQEFKARIEEEEVIIDDFVGLSSIRTKPNEDEDDFSTWDRHYLNACLASHASKYDTLIVVAKVTGNNHREYAQRLRNAMVEDEKNVEKEETYHIHYDGSGKSPSDAVAASVVYMLYKLAAAIFVAYHPVSDIRCVKNEGPGSPLATMKQYHERMMQKMMQRLGSMQKMMQEYDKKMQKMMQKHSEKEQKHEEELEKAREMLENQTLDDNKQ